MIPTKFLWASSLCYNPFNHIPMGIIVAYLRMAFCTFFIVLQLSSSAQTPVFKNAIATNRTKTHNNIVKNIITKNLSLPLTDSTEENWQDAFYAMEVLQYKQPWMFQKVKTAFDGVEKRSVGYQRSLLELVYTNYKKEFVSNTTALMQKTKNAKVFAMCAEYLLSANPSKNNLDKIGSIVFNKKESEFENDENSTYIIYELLWPIMRQAEKKTEEQKIQPSKLLNKAFLPSNVIVYSIQRKNRNYPGIAIIKDSLGNFITDTSGNIFSIPQLARSITNLPGYLTNGNTPQGIFLMNGFDISRSAAIGPTENIQLVMPVETTPQHFLKDSTITDTVWTEELYQRLLPNSLQNYHPLYGSYYASAVGRTEIIAHGTTVDPSYYKGQPYYPHTPTQGCLSTKEIWSNIDGRRTESNQQKLIDAVKKAGGANGYLIVFEIDNQQKPVTLTEILPYLKKAKK